MAKKMKMKEKRLSKNLAKTIHLKNMNQNNLVKSIFQKNRAGSMSPDKRRNENKPVRRGSIDLRKMFGNQGKLDFSNNGDDSPASNFNSSRNHKNKRITAMLKGKQRRSSLSGA
jgi:hypothetical protein